jgi:hypothetical protein
MPKKKTFFSKWQLNQPNLFFYFKDILTFYDICKNLAIPLNIIDHRKCMFQFAAYLNVII